MCKVHLLLFAIVRQPRKKRKTMIFSDILSAWIMISSAENKNWKKRSFSLIHVFLSCRYIICFSLDFHLSFNLPWYYITSSSPIFSTLILAFVSCYLSQSKSRSWCVDVYKDLFFRWLIADSSNIHHKLLVSWRLKNF